MTTTEMYSIIVGLVLSHGLAYTFGLKNWSRLQARKAYNEGYSDSAGYHIDKWVKDIKRMADMALLDIKRTYNAGITVIKEPGQYKDLPPAAFENQEMLKLPTVRITITVNHDYPFYWKLKEDYGKCIK